MRILHCGRDQENHREGSWPAQQPQWTDGRLLATSGLRSLPCVIKPLLTGTPISSSEDQLSYVRQSSSGWTVTVLRRLHYRWNSVDKIKIYRRAEWHAERTQSISILQLFLKWIKHQWGLQRRHENTMFIFIANQKGWRDCVFRFWRVGRWNQCIQIQATLNHNVTSRSRADGYDRACKRISLP